MHAHVQRMQAARIGAGDAEREAAQGQFLAGFRQVADRGGDQAADGVVFVVVEVGAEAFVEIGDRGQRIDHELAVGLRRDEHRLVRVVVVLVVDLADDLLQHVLDGDQPGHAAVFVDHDRHVVARLAELAQQHVELLRFGDQHRRPQQLADGAGPVVGDHPAQQVLGQQDAEDLVLVLAVHREARMAGLDHVLHQVEELRVRRQRHHLRARHHHVGHGHVGDRDRAFHHAQGVGGDQAVGLHVAQQLDQVFAGGRLAGQRGADAVQPGTARLVRGTFRGLRSVVSTVVL